MRILEINAHWEDYALGTNISIAVALLAIAVLVLSLVTVGRHTDKSKVDAKGGIGALFHQALPPGEALTPTGRMAVKVAKGAVTAWLLALAYLAFVTLHHHIH
jgi:hypothetical protein